MKTIKKIFWYTMGAGVLVALGAGMYYGEDILSKFRPVEVVETIVQTEVVVTDEFVELVRTFEESKEGQEVLHTWATQQALEVQREKLDAIEKEMLEKEATL